jgi:DNA polymerase III alpha subunit (gram-positive type)
MMPESHSLPDHINAHIHRPACPKCHAYMTLARIMPARMGFDLRTFECPKCEHVHELMVETDAFGMSSKPRQRWS